MSKRIVGLNSIIQTHNALFCDVWGVLHNGQSVYRQAANALASFRAQGGKVIMLTNSPRPNEGVREQFKELGVSNDVFDAVVTSGDVTRTLIAQAKSPVFHLGPDRDLPLYRGINVELGTENDCNAIVCTGLFEDETETPEDYRERLQPLAERGVPFICANPDIVVERGDRLIWCAGSLARLYEELGGKTLLAGKPHKPIYDLAMEQLKSMTVGPVDKSKIMAIGDGLPTDVAGAQNNGFDLCYISAGIHNQEYGAPDNPDEGALQRFLDEHKVSPTVWMPRLVWNQD